MPFSRNQSNAFRAAALNPIHADIVRFGTSALDMNNGCSTADLAEAEMKKTLMARDSM
jgi:DeoR/GlpR family transcriptional regulator of sugar metabolism